MGFFLTQPKDSILRVYNRERLMVFSRLYKPVIEEYN